MTNPTSAATTDALTPERLKELLAKARGYWQIKPDASENGIATTASTLDPEREGRECAAALIAISPALAARVIELEGEVGAKARRIAALEIAGKHLAVKLAEVYSAANANLSDCQALRDWLSLMPTRAALETAHD